MFSQRKRGGGEAPGLGLPGLAVAWGEGTGGAAVGRLCAGAPGRAARLGPNEVPTEFPAVKKRGKGKGRWEEGKWV